MKALNTVKLIAAVLLSAALFCTADLGLNLLYNADTSLHDGSYGTYSILHAVFGIFGDRLWSFDMFFLAFRNAALITFLLIAANVSLHFISQIHTQRKAK